MCVCVVGSISGPHLGGLRIKIMVSEDFSEPSFQRGGAKLSLFSGVLVQKRGFQKGGGKNCHFHVLFWWLLVDVTTRL